MGEFADMPIDDSLAEWEYAESGEDPDFSYEYFQDGGFFGGSTRRHVNRGVICKFCKSGPFEWGTTDRGWRLFDASGNMHSCKHKENR